MKLSRYTLFSLFLLVLVAAVYRVIPNRPWGFAPQFAMTLFCGAVMKDKKMAFLLPLVSMFISDLLYHFLYIQGFTVIEGFYDGMVWNYLIFGSLTFVGFFVNANSVSSILKGSLISPTLFFFVSNFITWMGGGGLQRPKTFIGLMQAFADGLPFYGNSLVATLVFGFILFGATNFIIRPLSFKSTNH
jgi:hypothetical protein